MHLTAVGKDKCVQTVRHPYNPTSNTLYIPSLQRLPIIPVTHSIAFWCFWIVKWCIRIWKVHIDITITTELRLLDNQYYFPCSKTHRTGPSTILGQFFFINNNI